MKENTNPKYNASIFSKTPFSPNNYQLKDVAMFVELKTLRFGE
jgi:hypothetical protein